MNNKRENHTIEPSPCVFIITTSGVDAVNEVINQLHSGSNTTISLDVKTELNNVITFSW